MCKDCGCSGHHHEHHHDHDHGEHGAHGHADGAGVHTHRRPDGTVYTHTHDAAQTREITLGDAVLSANDRIAEANRAWFRARSIKALNLISSPGSGKTTLLEKTLPELTRRGIRAAVIVGDQYGSLDADRMKASGVPVTQIETHSSCHLDAARIQAVLETAVPEGTQLLLIENVGNLVCPVAFDLGEDAKIALLSTPEGEEKPLKYPALFAAVHYVILTKIDLEKTLEWNYELCLKNIHAINRDAKIIRVAAKTREGLNHWMEVLTDLVHG